MKNTKKELFKVIVAGTRTFKDYDYLKETLDKILSKRLPNVEIVSGAARGADELGEIYATKHDLSIRCFPADWDKYGKSAGPRRNKQMAEYADACVVFWDGKSKGTKSMIQFATELGLPTRVVHYETKEIYSFRKEVK